MPYRVVEGKILIIKYINTLVLAGPKPRMGEKCYRGETPVGIFTECLVKYVDGIVADYCLEAVIFNDRAEEIINLYTIQQSFHGIEMNHV